MNLWSPARDDISMNGIPALLIQGFLIGIGIAAPVGPIGILCIRRTLSDGKLAGFLSGLGAATADMIYGGIAAYGLKLITEFLVKNADWMKFFGGLFLLYLGARIFLSKPAEASARVETRGHLAAYLSTLFLTITNPMTILSFSLVFAGAMPASATQYPIFIVLGVFAGSTCWWLALSFGVSLLRDRVNQASMAWVNRFSGSIILVFGVTAIYLFSTR